MNPETGSPSWRYCGETGLLDREILDACVRPPAAHTAHLIRAAAEQDRFRWASVLEAAIANRLLCLLADTLSQAGLVELPPPRIAQFLRRYRRCNLHATLIHREQADRIAVAARAAGLPLAMVKGIAVEQALYGGRGGREFSDIDLLVLPEHLKELTALLGKLGYVARQRGAASRRRERSLEPPGSYWFRTGDTLTPHVVIDVSTRWPVHRPDAGNRLARALAHASSASSPLPMLTPEDQAHHLRDLLGSSHVSKVIHWADLGRLLEQHPHLRDGGPQS